MTRRYHHPRSIQAGAAEAIPTTPALMSRPQRYRESAPAPVATPALVPAPAPRRPRIQQYGIHVIALVAMTLIAIIAAVIMVTGALVKVSPASNHKDIGFPDLQQVIRPHNHTVPGPKRKINMRMKNTTILQFMSQLKARQGAWLDSHEQEALGKLQRRQPAPMGFSHGSHISFVDKQGE